MESIKELNERIKCLEAEVEIWQGRRDMVDRFVDYLEAALKNPNFKAEPKLFVFEKPNRILKLVEELHQKARG